jgi:hypothetical protein
MGHEIGEGHLAGEDERHDPRVDAREQHEAAHDLKERRDNDEVVQGGPGTGKLKTFESPCR